MFSQEQWSQLLANFLEEARDLIQQAETLLLALDNDEADDELLNSLFRAVHTLKGSAGLFALDDFVAFTHHQESLIMRVRDRGLALDRPQISALLSGLDILRNEVELLATGAAPSALVQQHAAQFAVLQSLIPAEPSSSYALSQPVEPQVEREARSSGAASWHISLRFSANLFEFGFDPASFIRYLGKLGFISHIQLMQNSLPDWPAFHAEMCYLGVEVDLVTEATKAEIEAVFEFIQDLAQIRILPPESKTKDYLKLIADLPDDKELLGKVRTSP